MVVQFVVVEGVDVFFIVQDRWCCDIEWVVVEVEYVCCVVDDV